MKFAQKISSIRRRAWKACRSCSPASRSMCATSLASDALAGWIVSPRCRSTVVTGSCASQSISRPGTCRRSSSAIATSRQACPRPIGDDTNNARFGRTTPRRQVVAGGGAAVTRSANSRRSRLTLTGSRTCGAWPEPSNRTSSAPVSSATRSPRATGMTASSVPWTTTAGHVMLRQSASTASTSGRPESPPSMVRISVSGVVSRPQATQSSICFVECGSGKTCAKKNSRKPR